MKTACKFFGYIALVCGIIASIFLAYMFGVDAYGDQHMANSCYFYHFYIYVCACCACLNQPWSDPWRSRDNQLQRF